MYRFNDKQRRQLLEDALVEFLLDAPAAHTTTERNTRPEPKAAAVPAGTAVQTH